MQKKKLEGKIKHIGFSAHIDLYKLNYYIDLFEENFGKGVVDVAMLTYNIFSGSDWVMPQTGIKVWENPGPRGLELCKKHGITVVSMMPLESGRALEVSHDKTFTDWCYKFIFDNKNITSTLAGTSNTKHLQQMIDVYNANHNILPKKEEKVSKKLTKKTTKKESK
jgi:predicted aldo/keto reductase-like oxidoreductase